MGSRSALRGLLAVVVLVLTSRPGIALTVGELRALRDRGEDVVVIDVRSSALFEAGHIHGAIHLPAAVLARKPLPPLGRVVVCGDGVDAREEQMAVAALNSRPGIRAEALEGGYAAWAGAGQASSVAPGLQPGGVRQLAYSELLEAAANNRDLVLVDLRLGGTKAPLTNLAAAFPGVPVLASTTAQRRRVAEGTDEPEQLVRGHSFGEDRLYVLIDDGDGRASDAVASRLAGRGIGRVAILAGGEQALRTKGEIREETRETAAGATP